MVTDGEMNGVRLFHEIERLRDDPEQLERMRDRVRQFARPGAAERAAEILEEAAVAKKNLSGINKGSLCTLTPCEKAGTIRLRNVFSAPTRALRGNRGHWDERHCRGSAQPGLSGLGV
jgi:hypothetical protein